MKKLHTYINESIFDMDSKKVDNTMYLKTFNNILDKRMFSHTKDCIDMFGREIKVGDLCFAYITAEWHFIEVGEIIDDGGWKDIIPTVDYKYIDGQGIVHPYCCILIPEKQLSGFLKFMKSK